MTISLKSNAQVNEIETSKDSLEIEILKMLNGTDWTFCYGENGKNMSLTKIKDPIKLENSCLVFNFEELGYKKVSITENEITEGADAYGNPPKGRASIGENLVMIQYPYWTKNPKKFDKKSELANEQTKKLFNLLQNYHDIAGSIVRTKELDDFKIAVQELSESGEKPEFTEEQRKYAVQANAFNEKSDYNNAIIYYNKAMAINPCSFPEGYYNMALIAAQIKNFDFAILCMKKFLILKPDASDARAAQDKIYEWELNIK